MSVADNPAEKPSFSAAAIENTHTHAMPHGTCHFNGHFQVNQG